LGRKFIIVLKERSWQHHFKRKRSPTILKFTPIFKPQRTEARNATQGSAAVGFAALGLKDYGTSTGT
jgi:hypothetical protein